MKRIFCFLLAVTMLLSLTACGESGAESEKTAVVPLVYEQDGKTMLMDVNSGKTRQLVQAPTSASTVITSPDGQIVYYVDKSDQSEKTGTLYMIKGDIMTAESTAIAEKVWVYSVSYDGRVAAYIREDVLYRVVDGGKPEYVAESVDMFEFSVESNTLWYSVEDETAAKGDNVFLCHEDGSIEATDKLMSGWTHIPFQKDLSYENGKLVIEGQIIDDAPWKEQVAETADQLAYLKNGDDKDLPKGTLMLYDADGVLHTVSDNVVSFQWIGAYFLDDGSFMYYTCETEDINDGTWWRYYNEKSVAVFGKDSSVLTTASSNSSRAWAKYVMTMGLLK